MAGFQKVVLIPQFCVCGIPVLLAAMAVQEVSLWLGLGAIVALLILLRIIPLCKGRESLFSFLILTAMGLPLNIRVIIFLWEYEILGKTSLVSGVLWSVVFGGLLFSIEQIVMGTLVRCLWPRQFKTRASKIGTQ